LLNGELREVFYDMSVTSQTTRILGSIRIHKGIMAYVCDGTPAIGIQVIGYAGIKVFDFRNSFLLEMELIDSRVNPSPPNWDLRERNFYGFPVIEEFVKRTSSVQCLSEQSHSKPLFWGEL
jgi:hypothetical protein